MHTDLQEQFKNYLFEDVKAHLAEWCELCNVYNGYYGKKDEERKVLDKIIELRRKFAKGNGLKTVTPVCPKLKDIIYPLCRFINDYVKSESSRLTEEFKPLAIVKVVNDESLHDKLNERLKESFRDYGDGSRGMYHDIIARPRSALICYLDDFYKEVKHTFGRSADTLSPYTSVLAVEILATCFTPQFVVNPGEVELIEQPQFVVNPGEAELIEQLD
ncbi:MAG: hypothetical protein PUN43_05565 [Candidatus Liberibacter asiaticus]|nr:hypothetical protein [Candidatus Liberibacter asiaticus]